MRALGARVQQVGEGLIVAQVLSALPGAVLGVPLGLLLFKVAVHGSALPSSLFVWLGAMVVGTSAAMAVLTFMPALVGARESVAAVLQSESR
jgi:putative ABC transport system permease protein